MSVGRQAEIGGRYVWINGTFQPYVLAHELGHNLGLAHAGGLYCTSAAVAVAISSTCDARRAITPTTTRSMRWAERRSLRQMSMEHKLALGLLPASAVKVVGASGTYHLAPMETLSGGTELLRIPSPAAATTTSSTAQPIGFFDSQAPAVQGVLVRTRGDR